MGNIFRYLEEGEVSIMGLQKREDQVGGLSKGELIDLRGLLIAYHALFYYSEEELGRKIFDFFMDYEPRRRR